MNKLSEAAESALIAAKCNRQGTVVTADAVVITELFDQGLVGAGDGLTRKGTIARERLVLAREEAAFA